MEKDELIYQFHDTGLLTTAMTHSSYANEHRDQHIQNNERLEFLGDSILGLVSADYVFHRYPHVPEGQLTKLRAAVVCEQTLYEVAKELGLDHLLRLGRGEDLNGGRDRPSIISDAFEALLAVHSCRLCGSADWCHLSGRRFGSGAHVYSVLLGGKD